LSSLWLGWPSGTISVAGGGLYPCICEMNAIISNSGGIYPQSGMTDGGQMTRTAEDALADAVINLERAGFAGALHRWLSTQCAYDNIVILAFFDDRGPEVMLAEANEARVFEKLETHYVAGAYVLDPFFGLHRNKAQDGLYRLAEIAPDQFQRNEFHATYYERTTLIDEIVFFSRPVEGVSITVCLGRDISSGRKFSSRDRSRLEKIASVTNALVRHNWRGLTAKQGPEIAVSDQLRARLLTERTISLSPRQSEVALYILQGHSSISIGLSLGISPQTVKVLRKQLYRKCNISSQAELFALLVPYLSGSKDHGLA